MSFTNDELAELQKSIGVVFGGRFEAFMFKRDQLRELLRRLESAETIAQRHNIEHNPAQHDYIKDEKKCDEYGELKAWLKSKETA